MSEHTSSSRGATLLEVVFAMGILMIGAAGMAGMHRQSQLFLGDSRRLTRASYVAQDLANQIQLWPFTDPRLSNADTGNDADLADAAGAFLTASAPPADHGEADLTLGGRSFNGLDQGVLAANGMERFWNVGADAGDDANANGVPDSMRIAVIVRWPEGSGWRRYVFYTVKVNPDDRR
jgi:hypothetical protein